MPSGSLDDLQTSLLRLGRLLASRQASARLIEAAQVDVSQQGVALLRVLRREGQLPAAELASAAGMDLGAVSRQVRILEQAEAVARSSDPSDRRVALLELTPEGRGIADRLHVISARHMEAALAGWADADRRALSVLLRRLVDDLAATPMPSGDTP